MRRAAVCTARSGPPTIDHSRLSGNRARPEAIGRFAEGGGLFVDSGALTVRDSSVDHNEAVLVTSWPAKANGEVIPLAANAGGVHVGGGLDVSMSHSRIVHNRVLADDPLGEPLGFDAGMLIGNGSALLDHVVVSHNTAVSRVGTSDDVGPGGSALELNGAATVTHSRISDNSAVSFSVDGIAQTNSGLAVLNFDGNPQQVTLRHVAISGNTGLARSASGSAAASGGGVFSNVLLDLQHVKITGNTVTAQGPRATTQGGGVWNGVAFGSTQVVLAVRNSAIVGNAAIVKGQGTAQGGGVYTNQLTIERTALVKNRPDQCFGCSTPAKLAASGPLRVPRSPRARLR